VFAGLGLAPLALIFIAAAATVWVAGILLSSATDALDLRLGLGEALGGAILLAVATNLPEIAIGSRRLDTCSEGFALYGSGPVCARYPLASENGTPGLRGTPRVRALGTRPIPLGEAEDQGAVLLVTAHDEPVRAAHLNHISDLPLQHS
jgi:hypothetical protein